MAVQFEAYTAEGIIRGTAVPDGRLGDLLETFSSITLDRPLVTPLDGRAESGQMRADVTVDDLLVVVAPPSTPAPIHATWHELALVTGPYVVEGAMPTLPGFDPGRALARPTGSFVLLGSVRLTLVGNPAAGAAEYPLVWVNRYTVEKVQADIELGIFFPGAATALVSRGGRPDTAVRDAPAAGTPAAGTAAGTAAASTAAGAPST